MIVDLSVSAPGKKGGKLGGQIVNAEVGRRSSRIRGSRWYG
jgi:hypothetical protein